MKPISDEKRELTVEAELRGDKEEDIALCLKARLRQGRYGGISSGAGALRPIYEKGATVRFPPPYSQDCNPIEQAWPKVKVALRKLKAATFDELVDAMRLALDNITASDISACFKHHGYNVNI